MKTSEFFLNFWTSPYILRKKLTPPIEHSHYSCMQYTIQIRIAILFCNMSIVIYFSTRRQFESRLRTTRSRSGYVRLGGGVGGGGVLSSNFVHQMCHQGGGGEGGVLSSNFVHQMCHQGGEGGIIPLVAHLVDKVETKDPPPPLPPGGTSGGQSWN